MRKAISVLTAAAVLLSLAVAVAAETFVPSVTAKPAPEVSGAGAENRVEVRNEAGNVVATAEAVKLEVTSVSAVMNDGAEALSQERAENLKTVYEELSARDADITAVVTGLEPVLEENGVEAKDLVVKDLFDVSIHDAPARQYLEKAGHTIDVTFQADIQEGQFVMVAVYRNGRWILAKHVVVREDGTIVATLEQLGTVAIIVTPAEPAA